VPADRRRLLFAALVGLLVALAAGLWAWARNHANAGYSDFQYVRSGVLAWRAGLDPYTAVGYGRPYAFDGNLMYPAPALVVAAPTAWLAPAWADAAFLGLGAGLLAFALAWRRPWALLALGSFPALMAVASGQWSPLLTAGVVLAPLGGLLVCKPPIGLALGAYALSDRRWRAWAVPGGLLLLALAFVWQPDWPARWVAGMGRPAAPTFGRSHLGTYLAPVALLPAGPLALIALLRWRRPEARLVAVLACVPQTLIGYEALPLLALVPATAWEATGLAALSWAIPLSLLAAPATFTDHFVAAGRIQTWAVFLPAVLLVLRRPNVAPAP
jgi:hypothetical protein